MSKKMTDAEKAAAAKKREALKPEAEAKAAAEAAGDAPEGKPAPAAKPKAKAKAKAKAPVVIVKTVRGVKSRWRAGRGFGEEPVEINIDDLAEGDLEALQADPSLVVSLEG